MAAATAGGVGVALQAAEVLESILSGSVGPEGRQVLCTKPTGDVLFSRDGGRLLEALNVEHPVARMIVTCVSMNQNVTGDGAKTFIILLCDLLRGLKAFTEKERGSFGGSIPSQERHWKNCCQWKYISQAILTFQAHILDYIMTQYLRKHFLSIFSFSGEEKKVCRSSLESLLDAYFCGRVGRNNQKFISQLTCDYFYKCLQHEDGKDEMIDLVDEYFLELCTAVTGLPVSSSKIISGFVIHRDFSVYCPADGDMRIIIVTEPIQPALSTSGSELLINSEAQFQASHIWITEKTKTIMKDLQSKGIKLLLSSVKQQETVIYYAKQNGISVVEYIPSEEISLLCRIISLSPFMPSWATSVCHISDTALVTFCRPILLNSRRYVHLGLLSTHSFIPHCLILCGPVQGLTDQHIRAFHGAFKVLRQVFKVLYLSYKVQRSNQNETSNSINSKENKQSHHLIEVYRALFEKQHLDSFLISKDNPSRTQSHLRDAPDLVLSSMESKNDILSTTLTQTPKIKEDFESLLCSYPNKIGIVDTKEPLVAISCSCSGDSLTDIPDEHLSVIEQTCKMSRTTIDMKSKEVLQDPSQSYCTSFIQAGSVLPVGGHFEILLHYYLLDYSRQCQKPEVSMISSLIANALLSLPKTLYKAKRGSKSFCHVYLRTMHALQAKQGVAGSPAGLESVACKYQLLTSVLHCLTKLLTIDLVISINKQPQKTGDEETEEDG
ncbi:Bardet-Biedl syndrome 10 protein isoform X1 [Monodelphis domestica]|uniref:Bardet-Biedl syndrome 10 protein isoform X1 n=2 Tax=Monodelphis domestica TaxID=13616 RepID=UPI0024E20654|nr:Bardet-Biedl syndrome 10 protein isoform X1 [Monodelphis domestica]